MKNLAILGSTGSIGQQTLEIVKSFPNRFKVVGLAGGKNTDLLAKQISEFQPRLACSPFGLPLLGRTKLSSMEEIASHPEVDLLVVATTGKTGLSPTLAAIKAGKRIALANKEIIVMAGQIIIQEARQYHAKILPIDSEHSAIWQCLRGERNKVARLILTTSGGPFYYYSHSHLSKVTVEEALQHPTWKMGRKVTIDSATLMNKGLEVIEARWLFNIPFEKIAIIVHPQSITHSLVEFMDGSLKAQLSFPDMRLPIQYALAYPRRLCNPELPRIDLTKVKSLTFEPIDYTKFPCLKLALDAGKGGGTYPAVLCAADEVAVELFLTGQICFPDIPAIVGETLSLHRVVANPTLDDILAADAWARETTLKLAKRSSLC